MADKPVIWLGDSRETISSFADDARQIAGFQLWRVQRGLEPNDWKPLPSVGPGVQEIRIHTGVEHRVIYVAKFPEAVYVLHALPERTRRPSKGDVGLAQQRPSGMLAPPARREGEVRR